MPASYDVKISLVDGKYALPPAKLPPIKIGDNVRYVSDGGEVKIQFEGPSPYNVDTIIGSKFHQVLHGGSFKFHCFVKPHGHKRFLGWGKDYPESGGDQIIPKHP